MYLTHRAVLRIRGNNAYWVCLAHKRNYWGYYEYDYYSCIWCSIQTGVPIPCLPKPQDLTPLWVWVPLPAASLRGQNSRTREPLLSSLPFTPPPKPLLPQGVPGPVLGGKAGVLARDPATRQPRAGLHGDRAGRERSAEPRRPRARSRLCNATRSAEPGSGPDPS